MPRGACARDCGVRGAAWARGWQRVPSHTGRGERQKNSFVRSGGCTSIPASGKGRNHLTTQAVSRGHMQALAVQRRSVASIAATLVQVRSCMSRAVDSAAS